MPKFIKNTKDRFSSGRVRHFAIYECDCGNTFEANTDNVRYGITKSCGKHRSLKPLDREINGYKVVKDLGMNNNQQPKREAIFQCFCGNNFKASINNIKKNNVKSCGCLKHIANNKTHGLSQHILYRKWGGIITRTGNKNDKHYKRYGGRGIKMCDQWRNDFMSFYSWSISNGWKDGLTIDRIDNNGNYEPSNCQWISFHENSMKDRVMFSPTFEDILEICDMYIKTNITVTHIAKLFKTHKENISKILKNNNIEIQTNRRMKNVT